MIVYLDGRFVPEAQALIPVTDRAFLLGDGLFETLLIHRGEPFRWDDHLQRLTAGAKYLGLRLPLDATTLRAAVIELITRNQLPEAILRLTLSRGSGTRGYSPRGANHPRLVITLHPAPPSLPSRRPRWKLITSSIRLPARDPLARYKHLNRLPNVLARAEAEAAGADEALLLNTNGDLVETAAANLFWISDGGVLTPPLEAGALAGITRSVVFELCDATQIPVGEVTAKPRVLANAAGAFATLSTLGIIELASLDGRPLRRSPIVRTLQTAYRKLLTKETASKKTLSPKP